MSSGNRPMLASWSDRWTTQGKHSAEDGAGNISQDRMKLQNFVPDGVRHHEADQGVR